MELARREQAYRREYPAVDISGRKAILIDDGLATGSTMRAAVEAVRKRRPAHLAIAVPIAAPDAAQAVSGFLAHNG